MAVCNSIPAELADQISSRLEKVAIMLRAMRVLANNAEDAEQYEAVTSAVAGLSERCHQILDSCITKMSGGGLGNFDDSQWDTADDDAQEGGAA